MTICYFLTGSYKDQDNDFELQVTLPDTAGGGTSLVYDIVLTDTSNGSSHLWETAQPTFLECLEEMDKFLSDNFITLYSKILTSAGRDPQVDKELEGFILNRLEY